MCLALALGILFFPWDCLRGPLNCYVSDHTGRHFEITGLDGAEIARFLMGRDQRVGLRCAAAGFAVKDGLMSARTLVLDTTDTVIWGSGSINLATEALDLTFHPRPKDVSILSLRSPLRQAASPARR